MAENNNDLIMRALAKRKAEQDAAAAAIDAQPAIESVPMTVEDVLASPSQLKDEPAVGIPPSLAVNPPEQVSADVQIPQLSELAPALETKPMATTTADGSLLEGPLTSEKLSTAAPTPFIPPALAAAQEPAITPPVSVAPTTQPAAAAQPSMEEMRQMVDTALQGQRKQKAAELAVDELDDIRKKTEQRLQDMRDQAQEKMNELDTRVRMKSLPELLQGDWKQKLGAALALGLGAVSQGLSGAKTNPVVDYMQSLVDAQAAKDKLTLDEKEALARQVYQQGELELRKLENATNNAFRKDSIKLQREELAQKQAEISARLMADFEKRTMAADKFSGKALTPDQEATLTLEERRLATALPNGKLVLLNSADAAKDFREYSDFINNAVRDLREIKQIGQQNLNPITSPIEWYKAKGRVDQLKKSIIGAIRLPYFGPGAFQKFEQEQAASLIGDPTKILTLKSVEMNLLNGLEKDLYAKLQGKAKNSRIRERVTPQRMLVYKGKVLSEDDVISRYKQTTRLPEEKLRELIDKQVAAGNLTDLVDYEEPK